MNFLTDNLEEYGDPQRYDDEYGDWEEEGPFFLNLAQPFIKHSILEIACGTGRLTLPFAKQGFKVTALDICAAMLEHAKIKSQGLSIDWRQEDARNFHLNKKFPFSFMGGNAFQALLTPKDQKGFLDHLKLHLTKRGIFSFTTRNFILF
jgi:SAM-dependent methyltransferase